MDEYFQCLLDYIVEGHKTDSLLKTLEYQSQMKSVLKSWEAVENVLSQSQITTVDTYFSEYSQLSSLEKDWLFLEGVVLGRWLARQS